MDDDQQHTAECLPMQADLYSHHLYLSHFVREWARAVLRDAAQERGHAEAEYLKGYAKALTDMAGHLEDGEALPGGPLYCHVTQRFQGGRLA
ncbi:hypothetical protein [Mobilicoccus massiliensis]|uniref:hypothetical protein n=1 Tax=Mobilicoccus massiliensis TaxID=1522310 RepID=UPI0005907B83|nr:hypothetical protein [Mobilicoccus massiliensis]